MSQRKWALFLLMGWFLSAPASAALFTIKMKTPQATPSEVPAEDKKGKIWVNAMSLAESMGAKSSVQGKVVWMTFPDATIKIDPLTSIFSTYRKGQGKWTYERLQRPCRFFNGQLYVRLESLPQLFQQSFTYHRQKRLLEPGIAEKHRKKVPGFVEVPVRSVAKDGKVWISLEDLAETMGVLVYPFQSDLYGIVLPDFTIYELQVGQPIVYRQSNPYKRLEDPVILIFGSPYVGLTSIRTIFETEVLWDHSARALLVPQGYGRLREVKAPETHRLKVIGYESEPFQIKIDELSSYYQEPKPIYSSPNDQPYESTRDFLTNDAIKSSSTVEDRIGGQALAGVGGSFLGAPLGGRGSLQKIGGTTRLVNGSLGWGFPLFRIEGGREYITANGFNNQIQLVDQVGVSHSNDHYGEGEANPEWRVRAAYGENKFSVFLSTALFSQTVEFEQKMGQGSLGIDWTFSDRQQMGLKWDTYVFSNEVNRVSSEFIDQESLREIYGDDAPISIDPANQEALVSSFLTDEHVTSIIEGNYKVREAVEFSGAMGTSYYKEETAEERGVSDTDWRLRAVFGGRRRNVDVSFEKVGPKYRAIGNPVRYQNRDITRVAPYVDISKYWKVYGEIRRENSSVLESQGVPPYSNTYLSATNLLNFKINVLRASVYQFDSTLYGRQRSGAVGLTQYIGKHSLDLGGERSDRYDSEDLLYRKSNTGRGSFQLAWPSFRFSLGEEYTSHRYEQFDIDRWESRSNMLVQVGGFKTFFQYQIEPKYFLLEDRLYTGHVRMGHRVGQRKIFNLFYSVSSLESNLKDPEVWRAGFEYVTDLF